MTTRHPLTNERGTALITVLLMLTLALALVGGFVSTLVTDQQLRAVDASRSQVFYAAHGGLERLTTDLGNLFVSNFAPSSANVNALTSTEPVFDQVVFDDPGTSTGYQIQFAQANGAPVAEERSIDSGLFQGFRGLMTQYTMTVTARSANATAISSEVQLQRTLQTVAIPIFQFGIFSDTDLSYFPGPNFDFGGRVHTNGNLFLATGATLNLRDRVTAVGEVIRTNLSNGWDTNTSYAGTVNIARAPGTLRALARNEGSLVGTIGSAQRNPGWTTTSITDYNGYLRNGRTGARRLDLPFTTLGATPIDLIKRGVAGEEPLILAQRYYSLASIRILLSDTAADLTALPGVTAAAPVRLNAPPVNTPAVATSGATSIAINITGNVARPSPATNPVTIPVNTTSFTAYPGPNANILKTTIGGTPYEFNCTGRTTVAPFQLTGCTTPGGMPVGGITASAGSPLAATIPTIYRTPATPLIDGFIKIEIQRADQTWVDVTQEILRLGITSRNGANGLCADPSPNAIIRIQRLRDDPTGGNGPPAGGGARCGNTSASALDYWPNTLYDAREGYLRDTAAADEIRMGGVMHYVELDVNNLRRWFVGEAGMLLAGGVSGINARSVNGYTLFFSDRRTNRNAANQETGEYGFEDFVNPAAAGGLPNGVEDLPGEDVHPPPPAPRGPFDTYGQMPRLLGTETGPAAFNTPAALRPWSTIAAIEGKANRQMFFRRALKLVNGQLDNLPMPGFTVAAENPVYVQGNYNAFFAGCSPTAGAVNYCFSDARNAAAAIIADAVTLLSNNWTDNLSFAQPDTMTDRNAVDTWYRTAILSGKGRSFPQPGGTAQDYGTDGGVHNFLRYLEDWSGQTLYYRGSLASLYYNRQAVGTFKCCNTVYGAPTRGYNFDTEFLQPNLLPPFTPMFRDVNTTGFRQIIR